MHHLNVAYNSIDFVALFFFSPDETLYKAS